VTLKSSQKRRLALIGHTEGKPSSEHTDERSEKEQDELLEWAAGYVRDHLEIQTLSEPVSQDSSTSNKILDTRMLAIKRDVENAVQRALTAAFSLPPDPVECRPPSVLPPLDPAAAAVSTPAPSPLPPLRPSQSPPQLSITAAATATFGPALPMTPPLTAPSTSLSCSPSAPLNETSPTPCPSLVTPPPVRASVTKRRSSNRDMDPVKKLTLASGVELTYKLSEVPDPPSLKFTGNDIDLLARHWSDDHPEFNARECEVVIQGHGIALKYWPKIFAEKPRNSSDRRWSQARGSHNEYKFVAEEYIKVGDYG
ncbi:hypothetical protein V5O48_015878, partial [Marasmius crinis-equi]